MSFDQADPCTPPCAIACIYICAHVKDPVVPVRLRWKYGNTSIVGWVARLCCSWFSPRKATQISHGRNPNRTIQLSKKKKKKAYEVLQRLICAAFWMTAFEFSLLAKPKPTSATSTITVNMYTTKLTKCCKDCVVLRSG